VLTTFVKVNLLLVLACFVAEAFCKYVLHLSEAFTYPLLSRDGTFWDFILYRYRFQFFHHPRFFETDSKFLFMYPAPASVFYELFFAIPHPLRTFLGFMIGSFVLAAFLLQRALSRRGVSPLRSTAFLAASLLLAYPLWFDIKQANVEIGVWALVALGVWAFCKGRGYSAAACFGVAGSMKVFPFVYVGLLLSQRKYREMAFAALVVVFATIASLWLVGGANIFATWGQIQLGLDDYRARYMLQYWSGEIGFDHSTFGLLKCWYHSHGISYVPARALRAYLAIAAISGIALYFFRIRHLPIINQVLCLSVASVLLPPVSYDYTLIHLYVPWAMLVLHAQDQWKAGRSVPGMTAAFVVLAILVSPESEFIHNAAHVGGQFKAVILVALMFIALKYPFETVFSQRNERPTLAGPTSRQLGKGASPPC
jgi:hypothetical protein